MEVDLVFLDCSGTLACKVEGEEVFEDKLIEGEEIFKVNNVEFLLNFGFIYFRVLAFRH